MPNILSDVLPGKVVLPLHIVNCTREICGSPTFLEAAGGRAWLPVCRQASFSVRDRSCVSHLPIQTLQWLRPCDCSQPVE